MRSAHAVRTQCTVVPTILPGPTKQLFWPQCPIMYDLPMGLAFNPLEQSITMGWVPTFPMGVVLEEPHHTLLCCWLKLYRGRGGV